MANRDPVPSSEIVTEGVPSEVDRKQEQEQEQEQKQFFLRVIPWDLSTVISTSSGTDADESTAITASSSSPTPSPSPSSYTGYYLRLHSNQLPKVLCTASHPIYLRAHFEPYPSHPGISGISGIASIATGDDISGPSDKESAVDEGRALGHGKATRGRVVFTSPSPRHAGRSWELVVSRTIAGGGGNGSGGSNSRTQGDADADTVATETDNDQLGQQAMWTDVEILERTSSLSASSGSIEHGPTSTNPSGIEGRSRQGGSRYDLRFIPLPENRVIKLKTKVGVEEGDGGADREVTISEELIYLLSDRDDESVVVRDSNSPSSSSPSSSPRQSSGAWMLAPFKHKNNDQDHGGGGGGGGESQQKMMQLFWHDASDSSDLSTRSEHGDEMEGSRGLGRQSRGEDDQEGIKEGGGGIITPDFGVRVRIVRESL